MMNLRSLIKNESTRRKALVGGQVVPEPERCVQCGACIVQCPFDALCFEDPQGGKIPPETVRKFKLNMMGRRIVRS